MMTYKSFLIAAALTLLTVSSYAKEDRITIEGPNGALVADVRVPDNLKDGGKCPMVILMHGFTGKRDNPVPKTMADSLYARGIASIRFDFDGHGESGGTFTDMTVPKEIEDAKTVYEYVRALPYVSKIGFCGHSQGGVVASMTAGELGKKAVKAVVLFAPAAVLREDCIRGNTMGAIYDPLDPPESVALPGRGLYLGKGYIETAFFLPIYETAALYKGPACILHGTGDKVVPYTYGERFHGIWKGSELHIIPGEDHGFSKELSDAVSIATRFFVKVLL